MSKWNTGIWVLAVVGLIAAPAMAQNMLLNPGFEDGVSFVVPQDRTPDYWVLDGVQAETVGWFWGAGPRTGASTIGTATNWGYQEGTVEQTIAASGPYNLSLTFWAWLCDSSWMASSVTGEIVVDGSVVASSTISITGDNTKKYIRYTKQGVVSWQGTVAAEITVRIVLIADGPGGDGWGIACVDDVELLNHSCGSQHEIDPSNPLSVNTITYNPSPAEATATISDVVAEAETVTINVGASQRVYEFDVLGDGVSGTNVLVDVTAAQDKVAAKTALITAITNDAASAPCSAADAGGDDILLTWDTASGHGAENAETGVNITITNFVDPGAATTVTINGISNMTLVTGVRLWRTGPYRPWPEPLEITGTITGSTNTTVTVDLAAAGAPPAYYDLIVEQAGCRPTVIAGAFEIRNPAAASPNLLINGSFEVAENVGNAQIWFGNYIKDWYGAPPTPRSVDPLNNDPAGIIAVSGEAGTETSTSWQTVPVTNGDNVTFVGWVACRTNDAAYSTSSATISLYNTDNLVTPIATQTVTQATPPTDPTGPTGNWVRVELHGTANASAHVMVKVVLQIICTNYRAAFSGADGFSLTVDAKSQCTTRAYPLYAKPSTAGHADSISMTVTGGTNLHQVTGIKLVYVDEVNSGATQDEPEVEIVGTGLTKNALAASASFDLSTGPAHIGSYNLVIEQASCPSANLLISQIDRGRSNTPHYQMAAPPTFVDIFGVTCSDDIVLGNLDPSAKNGAQGTVDLIIRNGQNLNLLSLAFGGVKLVGPSTIDGQVLAASDTEATVRFNLAGANFGVYNLVGVRFDTLCNDPAPVVGAFTLSSAWNTQLLKNGGFDDDPLLQPVNHMPVDDWPDDPSYNQGVAYNPDTHKMNPVAGLNMAGVSGSGQGYNARVYQVVGVVPSFPLTLRGWIAGRSASGRTYDHFLRIRDGSPNNGAILAQFSRTTGTVTSWTDTGDLIGTPTLNQVRVEWGYENGPGSWDNAVATNADEITLIQSPGLCYTPFADVDGDQDVDQEDFAIFQLCYQGGTPGPHPQCFCLDVGGTPDTVDQSDLVEFEKCATGPGIEWTQLLTPDCTPSW